MEIAGITSPQPLCWHQGMLLSPQHFQQDQLYWQAQIQLLRQTLSPNAWGIISFEIDKGALIDGIVRIVQICAVMPDGMTIQHDAQREALQNAQHDARSREVLRLSLKELNELNNKRCTRIYLAVPKRVPGCVSKDKAQYQRYEAYESEKVMDDNTGDNELPVQRLAPKIKLLAAEQVSENEVCLPLMDIVQPDDNTYFLGDYCPPLINLAAQDYILDEQARKQKDKSQSYSPPQSLFHIAYECRKLAQSIRRKARHLAGYSAGDENRLGQRISELHRSWIKVLTKNLVELELLVDDPNTHPHTLYCLLSRMMGNFTEFNLVNIPNKLAGYTHKDLIAGFKEAHKFLLEQLDQVNITFTSIHFDEDRNGHFSLLHDKKWGERDLLVELTGGDNLTTGQLQAWFKACRIVSTGKLEALKESRVLGATADPQERDEQTGISEGPGRALFRIKYDADYIEPGRRLIVFCTAGKLRQFKPKRITLHLSHEVES